MPPCTYDNKCPKISDNGFVFISETLSQIDHNIYEALSTFALNVFKEKNVYLPKINKVIFNDPATIVFWKDGTKTVVKCGEKDTFDKEKGLAMAITKKAFGNKYDYYDIFLKFCK